MAKQSKNFQKKSSKDRSKVDKRSKKSFKAKRESNNAIKSVALPLQLEDDVPDFPRGWFSIFKMENFPKYYFVSAGESVNSGVFICLLLETIEIIAIYLLYVYLL